MDPSFESVQFSGKILEIMDENSKEIP